MTGIAREILLRTQPNGLSFFQNIWRTQPVHPKNGDPAEERSIAVQITGSKFVGPIADKIEDKIFVSAYKKNLTELGNFEKTGSDRLHIVSAEFKDVIERLHTPRFRGQRLTADSLLDSRLSFGGGVGRADWFEGRRVGDNLGIAAA